MLKASQQAAHALPDIAKFIKVLQQGIVAIRSESDPALRAIHFIAYLSGALHEIDSALSEEVGNLIDLPRHQTWTNGISDKNINLQQLTQPKRRHEERFIHSLTWLADAILEQKLDGEAGAHAFVTMLADNLYAAGSRSAADKLYCVLQPERQSLHTDASMMIKTTS